MIARRYWISGRVQGVWFRGATAKVARQLSIRGFAKNLRDGRVEVLAIGDSKDLDQLQEWLGKGPPSARVADVDWQDVEAFDEIEGFFTC